VAARPQGAFLANAAHGLAQGRPGCRRRGAQGVPGLGRRHGIQPRSGALSGRRGDGGPRRPVRARRSPTPRASPPPGRATVERGDRPLGLVCRVVRQARPGARRAQPGRRAVLQHLGPRADRRRGRPGAATLSSLLGLVSVIAPVIVSGNTASSRQPGPPAARPSPSPSPGHLGRAGRRRQPHHRAHRRDRALAGLAPRRQRHRPHRGRRREGVDWGELEAAAADNLKRVLRPGRCRAQAVRSPTGAATPDLHRMTAFLETKTVWHPKGR
jgi:hypothetical protein